MKELERSDKNHCKRNYRKQREILFPPQRSIKKYFPYRDRSKDFEGKNIDFCLTFKVDSLQRDIYLLCELNQWRMHKKIYKYPKLSNNSYFQTIGNIRFMIKMQYFYHFVVTINYQFIVNDSEKHGWCWTFKVKF